MPFLDWEKWFSCRDMFPFLQGGSIMCYFWLPMILNLVLVAAASGEEPTPHYSFRYHTSSGSSENMQTLTFSPDSQQLAVSVSNHVDLIDLREGEILYEFRASPFSLSYTPDGKRLYMISIDQAVLLDVQSGVVIPSQYRPVTAGPGINIEEHNGKLLIKSMVRGSAADAGEGLHAGDEIVAFSEGRNGEMRRITGWSLKSATDALKGYAGTFVRLTVLPRGRYGSKYEKTLTLRRTTVAGTNSAGGVAVNLQRTLPKPLAWCMVDGQHEFRDASSGNPIAHLETIDVQNVGLYAISPDGTKFAVVARRKDREGNAVEVFDLATQERLAFIPLSKSSFFDIAFAPDSNCVLVGTWDTIEICDTDKGEIVSQMTLGYQLPGKDDSNSSIGSIGHLMMNSVRAGIADGSSAGDRSPRQLVARFAVSSRNIVAVGDPNGNIGLWDLTTGNHVQSIESENNEPVERVQFSPDGCWLAYYVDGTLHLEDVSRAKVPDHDATPPLQNNSDEILAEDSASTIARE